MVGVSKVYEKPLNNLVAFDVFLKQMNWRLYELHNYNLLV